MKSLTQFILEASQNKFDFNDDLLFNSLKELSEIKNGKKISDVKDGDKVNIIILDHNYNIHVFSNLKVEMNLNNFFTAWYPNKNLTPNAYHKTNKNWCSIPIKANYSIIPRKFHKVFVNANIYPSFDYNANLLGICLADDTNIELIKSFLNDNKEKLIFLKSNTNTNFDILWDNFFGGLEISSSKETKLKRIITNFTKGVKSLKIEASEEGKDYWESYGIEKGLIKQNNDVKDEVDGLPGNAEWEEEETFALLTDGDTLLVRCNWDDDPNGEYFDLKVTAEK